MIHWIYNIGYLIAIALFCEVAYDQGIREHINKVNVAMSMCKAGKYEDAYVAFAYGGVRCFKESTQWPHRAKGYTLVSHLDIDEDK